MPYSICRPILARARDATTTITAESLDVISSAIEDVVLQGLPDACMVIGTQRLSRTLPHHDRYQALAAACRRLALCGVADAAPQISGVTLITLRPEWPAASEWFMAVSAPSFSVALLAVERTEAPGRSAGYDALFSAEPRLVDGICRAIAATLGLGWGPPSRRDDCAQQQHMALVRRRLLHHQQCATRARYGAEQLLAHIP
jgi:hypothetical protein